MKKIKIIKLAIMCLVLLATLTVVSFKTYSDNKVEASIVGTWVSEEDTNWKIIFTSSTSKWYYQNVLINQYSYTLSNTTPQCGETVSITSQTNYLQITNSADPNDKTCYEVFGISMESLTISMIGSAKLLMFDRQ